MDLGISITVVGCVASFCPIAITWIKQRNKANGNGNNGNGKPCALHPTLISRIEEMQKVTQGDIAEIKHFAEKRDDEVWEAIKEIRLDVKELLKR